MASTSYERKFLQARTEYDIATLLFENAEKEYRTAKLKAMRRDTEFFWDILAIPNKIFFYVHIVARFSSYERAERFIPPGEQTLDRENDCLWTYSIRQGRVASLTDLQIMDIDMRPPDSFPYGGGFCEKPPQN